MRQNDPYRSTNPSSSTIGKGCFPIKPSNINGNLQCCNDVNRGLFSFHNSVAPARSTRRREASAGSSAAVGIGMENGTPNIAQSGEGDASQIHPMRSPKQVTRDSFETMVRMLGATSHVDIVQLFAGRVAYYTIADWRRGKATIPRWALGYLATLCEQRASVFLSGAALGNNAPTLPAGRGSHRNIAAWNARRAALKAK